MQNNDDQHDEFNGTAAVGFLAGLLIGGLAGATTMLLMAPQSGKRTRAQIRHTGRDLRDQATEAIEDGLTEARATGQHLSARVSQQTDKLQHQAEKIQQRGQAVIDAQKERWAPVVEAGKTAVQGS